MKIKNPESTVTAGIPESFPHGKFERGLPVRTALKIKILSSPLYFFYRQIVNRLSDIAKRGKWHGWIYAGAECASGLPFRVAYAGGKQNKNYVFSRIFCGLDSQRDLGLASCAQLTREARQAGCDLMIFETDAKRQRHLGDTQFMVPVWAKLKLPLPADADALHHNNNPLQEIRRLFRKWDFRYEFARDDKTLSEFYSNLHVPFILQNHKDEALLHPYHEVRRRFHRGELLLAYRDGECVAGVLLEYDEYEARLSFVGTKAELVKEGILSALYFRAILRIKEKKLGWVNFGDSHGFLKDGSLRFKAKIGCILAPSDPERDQFWTFKILRHTPALKSFLLNHPFISLEEGKSWGVFFTPVGQESRSAEALTKNALCRGLAGIRIYPVEEKFDASLGRDVLFAA